MSESCDNRGRPRKRASLFWFVFFHARVWLLLAAILAVLGGAIWWVPHYAGELIANSHSVGKHAVSFPADVPFDVTDVFIEEGLQAALQRNGLSTNIWKMASDIEWHTNEQSLRSVVVDVSNRLDGQRLYFRVDVDLTNRLLEYNIYRPK